MHHRIRSISLKKAFLFYFNSQKPEVQYLLPPCKVYTLYCTLMSLVTSFDRFCWNFQRLLALVNLEFLFFIWLKIFCYKDSQVLKIFYVFIEYTQLFYFSTDFQAFLLSFSCCPAELKSVVIFKISLPVFEFCQKYFFFIIFRK